MSIIHISIIALLQTNKYITALCITACYITIDTPIFDNVKKSAVELSGKKYKVRKNGGRR